MAGYGTLYEVKKVWQIDDVADAHEILDLKEEAERKAMQPQGKLGRR